MRKLKQLFLIFGVGVILLGTGVLLVVKTLINQSSGPTKTPRQNWKCARNEPYKIPPEFTRAISLIIQRNDPAGGGQDGLTAGGKYGNWLNCIDIKYKDLSNDKAEGIFVFDTSSSLEHMMIYVDDSYQIRDDLLTAILLSHELKHARQTIDEQVGGVKRSCVDKEAIAYVFQIMFTSNLNDEEFDSLNYRAALNPSNPAYSQIYLIGKFGKENIKWCDERKDEFCKANQILNNIREWVRSNPYYQKQCSL
jgi:hypothetical protein